MPEATHPILVREEKIQLPTYLPAPPSPHPMFLEKRVYQGSNGGVYPLPFTDRIAEQPTLHDWHGIWLENEYLRVLVLPEIGGRVHVLQDKVNGYDLIYRQDVIKPALVGLAGPWISGGIEFNWPQHHRPATFLPTEARIERGDDGSVTVWCGDHDPMARMKAMHGICLRPGIARLELRVRAHNRTPLRQSFLWWANVATRVHEDYQSFFPPDVHYVADHAKRAMSAYPLCQGSYYGVPYADRARAGVPEAERPEQFRPPSCGGNGRARYPANDLSFYANIPVPTSYMCMGTNEDFFGGYDHRAKAGILHVANHDIAPGKKQWTWGNHEFGYAWDRNLTDPDVNGKCAPYIELMAGVFTDNQPDFSFLEPGESKTWTQYWMPIREIGPVQQANENVALSARIDGAFLHLGIQFFRQMKAATLRVRVRGESDRVLLSRAVSTDPQVSWQAKVRLGTGVEFGDLEFEVRNLDKNMLLTFSPPAQTSRDVPAAATEPPPPEKMTSNDELYLTGLHLWQYRHATRDPEVYWREAIRRDPGDTRCHTVLADWHYRRGEFDIAEEHVRAAVARLTFRNPNPPTGEAHFLLGLILRATDREEEAYGAFYKALWNEAQAAAAYRELAQIDCQRNDWDRAVEHLSQALRRDADHLGSRCLMVMAQCRLGQTDDAALIIGETLKLDPLCHWTRWLQSGSVPSDVQAVLDLAHDLARSGFVAEAIQLLENVSFSSREIPAQNLGVRPLVLYTLGWLNQKAGHLRKALSWFRKAAKSDAAYCFPARLEEIAILEAAMKMNPSDFLAPALLGNLLYADRRHKEAITFWETSVLLCPEQVGVWRNLGIAYFNIRHLPRKARDAYRKALNLAPDDERLIYEYDQLLKRLGESPKRRLKELSSKRDCVEHRDDLCVSLAELFNQTGQPAKARELLDSRRFQPWEGGEALVLGQHVRTENALARAALAAGRPLEAVQHLKLALNPPQHLSEARHLLANASDIYFWLGEAHSAAGNKLEAIDAWERAAAWRGDFQSMSVCEHSEKSYFTGMSLQRLGRKREAREYLQSLLTYAEALATSPAKIDYFATSLPTLLLFNDDLKVRQNTRACFLKALACFGLGRSKEAKALIREVLQQDPNHSLAGDFNE